MPRICAHLDEPGEGWDYAQYYSGIGLEYALICLACRKAPEDFVDILETLSRDASPGSSRAAGGFGGKDSIFGRPQVLERPTGLRFLHREVALAWEGLGGIADLRPIPSSGHAAFLVPTEV